MSNRFFALVLLLLGVYLFLNSLHIISFNPIYILATIISLIFIILIVKLKIENKIEKLLIKSSLENSLYTIQLDDGEYYFLAFKIIGKENNGANIDYVKELEQAIATVQRNKTRYLKVAIITLLDPLPGSAILFYVKKDKNISKESLLSEAMVLKSTIESVAPHISLEPVGLNANLILPVPKVLGSVVYGGYVGQRKFDIKSDHNFFGEYDIEIGKIIGNEEIPIGIRSDDVFKHVAIFGSTGSGKSNTSMLLARELYKKGFDVIILDWHGEYRQALPEFNFYGEKNYLTLNPIDVDDLATIDITEIFGDVLELTEPQKFILYLGLEVLNQMKEFDFRTLLQVIISSFSDNTFMQRDIKFALTRKIIMLFSGLGEKLISSKNGYTYRDLAEKLKGGNIIDLSFIRNIKLRKLYAMMVLKFLLEYVIETKNGSRKIFIIIEEAQNYFNQSNVIINKALQEVRKFNVGVCIISQSPSNVDPEVIKNTNIKIIHSIKSNVDKKVIADSLSLDKEEIQILDKLDVGEAILAAPNLRKEVIIKIKKV
mgnify:CR=1 FL=1